VADLATRDLHPVEDVHADGDYRRRAAAVLVRRAIEQATASA
jgi:CO/xanthine dehydrogenase FAD-binding subunit